MMQKLCAFTERVNAAAARIVRAASAPLGNLMSGNGTAFSGMTATDTTGLFFGTTAWNVIPSVHTTAPCTHGKRYERRLQEMLT